MTPIKEDYVSFETAKLLKEKGFPQEYDIYHSMVYNEEDYEDEYEVQRMVLETRLIKAGTLSSYPVGVPEPKCYCCTLQMVMKWLREVHNIHIDIDPDWASKGGFAVIGYCLNIHSIVNPWYEDLVTYPTYEQAVEAAIKYSLENLI